MEVEAWVVDIEHAAGADDAGLLNPLLHCFQRHVFNVNVWALPAVEVPPLLAADSVPCIALKTTMQRTTITLLSGISLCSALAS